MRLLFILLFLPFIGHTQTYGNVWSELSLKGKFTKKLEWGFDINARFGPGHGVQSFFPNATLKYKVTSWFKPSVDFRFIMDKDKFSNYQPANRVMVNASFDKDFTKRFKGEIRLRYQYEFERWTRNSGYINNQNQAVRLKPELSYKFKNNAFTPYVNSEIYYNLSNYNYQFDKLRFGIGTDIDVDDPLTLSVGYIYERELNDKNNRPKIKHIATFSIKYKF